MNKLINTKTNEEYLCDKVTIDGFDYYVSDELPKDNEGYWIYIGFNQPLEVNKSNQPFGWFEKLWDKHNYKTPIATTNPNIDLPQVVNEIEKLAIQDANLVWCDGNTLENEQRELNGHIIGFTEGYNKAKKDFGNSDEDMVDFVDWLLKNCVMNGTYCFIYKDRNVKIEELIQLWKEQQTKTIYYE